MDINRHGGHRFPLAAGLAARLAWAHAGSVGVRTDALLERAGLTRDQIEDPRARFPARAQIEFLTLVGEAIGDDHLGFHLARRCELREIGLLYYVLASSPHLSDMLRRGARYSSLANEGVALLAVHEPDFGARLRYVGVSRHRDRHQAEFWLTVIVRLVRQITNVPLAPKRLCVAHRREPASTEMTSFFGQEVLFGAQLDEVAFDRGVRSLPIVNADPYLNKLLVDICEQAVAHRAHTRGTFSVLVENTVASLLPHGSVRAQAVASLLGVSDRTLARRLAAEGTSFSKLFNGLRRDLANQYLSDGGLSVSEIAWLLGYSDTGGFSHAYKRWTGHPPRGAARRGGRMPTNE